MHNIFNFVFQTLTQIVLGSFKTIKEIFERVLNQKSEIIQRLFQIYYSLDSNGLDQVTLHCKRHKQCAGYRFYAITSECVYRYLKDIVKINEKLDKL